MEKRSADKIDIALTVKPPLYILLAPGCESIEAEMMPPAALSRIVASAHGVA